MHPVEETGRQSRSRAMENQVATTMNHRELAALADLLPDAVVVIDESAAVCWANQAAERLMGRPLATWLGTNGLELLHPDDIGAGPLSLESVQDKQVGTPIELRIATAGRVAARRARRCTARPTAASS